ncbi:hypothetical protein [Flavobacterium sp.]|jgi:hypothetical protein|uniref:hypothetical protein n=1 Tax=Flavobacterium sp. TaxID=239 RepID=UPI0037C04276
MMRNYIYSIVFLLISFSSFAQVGIGTIAPAAGSLLELKATDKALILTRVAGTAVIASPVDGMIVYDNSLNCFRSRENGVWTPCWNCCATPSTTAGTISALDCAGVLKTGTLTNSIAASAVSAEFSYTGGNGGTFTGQAITSTGITGLTATLVAGNLATGTGTVTYVISGTPSAAGTSSFALTIAGQNCTLILTVL